MATLPRIAVVSDIHGNRTAFEAVLADLRITAPDLVLHGGDLADTGSSPIEIVDRIRDLGWKGVVGNTDEMLFRPESLSEFAAQAPALADLLAVAEEMAAATREALGQERLAWLRSLPRLQALASMALVHASPDSIWRSPAPADDDAKLTAVYGTLGRPAAVYGHIHTPFVRPTPGLIVANSGSVGLPYDGDRRAAYLLVDGDQVEIRRVEYDVDREVKALATSGRPHWAWVAKTLQSASPSMP